MSKMYLIAKTDARKNIITSRAHYHILVELLYHDKHNPKRIKIEFYRSKDKNVNKYKLYFNGELIFEDTIKE